MPEIKVREGISRRLNYLAIGLCGIISTSECEAASEVGRGSMSLNRSLVSRLQFARGPLNSMWFSALTGLLGRHEQRVNM